MVHEVLRSPLARCLRHRTVHSNHVKAHSDSTTLKSLVFLVITYNFLNSYLHQTDVAVNLIDYESN